MSIFRILLDTKTKQKRCACVKNFGPGLSGVEAVQKSTNRGDLDHPHLKVRSRKKNLIKENFSNFINDNYDVLDISTGQTEIIQDFISR